MGKSDPFWEDFRAHLKARFPNDVIICECDNSTHFGGAEKLLGRGDMLFYLEGAIERCQAVLTEPQDLRANDDVEQNRSR